MTDNFMIAEIIDIAADRLAPPGVWGQGGVHPGSARLLGEHECVVTALNASCSYYPLRGQARSAIQEFLGLTNDTVLGSITYWNDTPGRTAAEVVQVLRDCAEKLRMGEEA